MPHPSVSLLQHELHDVGSGMEDERVLINLRKMNLLQPASYSEHAFCVDERGQGSESVPLGKRFLGCQQLQLKIEVNML